MCLGWWRCGRWWDGVARVWAGYGGWELVELCNGDVETAVLSHGHWNCKRGRVRGRAIIGGGHYYYYYY
jgi:hypothetical protein